jgi:hypothetical protein
MSDLKGILDNPLVKSMLLKQLKKAWTNGKLQLITITEKDGELEFNVYSEPMKVLTQKDFVNIITA